jgi:hypothetical protein
VRESNFCTVFFAVLLLLMKCTSILHHYTSIVYVLVDVLEYTFVSLEIESS